jgi:hypothetical protein
MRGTKFNIKNRLTWVSSESLLKRDVGWAINEEYTIRAKSSVPLPLRKPFSTA